MNPQLMLPFPGLSIPDKHLQWFKTANAGNYVHKRAWFYPLKSLIMKRHGIADGYDVQIIKKPCYCGDGIWRGIYDDLPEHLWDRCRRCSGTGVYERKVIILRRWLLNGEVFHEPTTLQPWQVRAKGCIRGLVVHEHVSTADAERAMMRLLIRYDLPRWYDCWSSGWAQWLYNKRVRARILILDRLRRAFGREEEIPF